MNYVLTCLLAIFMVLPAMAGFEGRNGGVSLGIFDKINCGNGVECTKLNGVLKMRTGTQNQIAVTATTITEEQCGSTFISGSVVQIELPEASAVLGCRLTFIIGTAQALTINPDDADQIMLLTDAAGDSLVADAIGESLVIEAISATQWAPVSAEKGTWTDSN